MTHFDRICLTVAALLPLAGAVAQQPPALAFPGAEGAGRFSQGGRDGPVIRVVNLNDSGAGSLRAAVETTGPRTIEFDIAGTIALESPLRITEPRVTISGESAPGDGVAIRNFPLIVAADDVVIRYFRSRLGDEKRSESDALWIASGKRIILDHVSASWSVDETLSVNNACNDPAKHIDAVTVQWSIISESLNESVHVKGPHGYGSLITACKGARLSFHHNLWAHHQGRNPRPGNPAPPDRDPIGGFHEYRSNVFYDWGGEHSGYNADTGSKASLVQYNFIDNAYIQGPASTGTVMFKESNELAKAWFSGNTMNGVLPADPWSLVTGKAGPEYRLSAPADVAPVTPDPAESAYERVLADAGASRARDAVDLRIVQSVRERKGRLINSQKDVGGWPELKATAAPRNQHPPIKMKDGRTFSQLQTAIDALPAHGGEIQLAPGEYRERITISKPGVHLRGTGPDPRSVVIVWSTGANQAAGTFNSATLHVSGDDFSADNLTVQNDYSLLFSAPSQGVALSVTGDRAVFTRVRLLGAQDTLHAGSRKCATGECPVSRQYFRDCYIEGHVDFIFGDSKAFFDRCHIHAIARESVMITAHARTDPEQDKAFVFDRCRITADPGAEKIYLGRPWRDYSRVIFMNTRIDADLQPDGWREWTPGETQRLKTAYYAEYRSSGRGANPKARQPNAHQLSRADAQRWSAKNFLAGADGWRP